MPFPTAAHIRYTGHLSAKYQPNFSFCQSGVSTNTVSTDILAPRLSLWTANDQEADHRNSTVPVFLLRICSSRSRFRSCNAVGRKMGGRNLHAGIDGSGDRRFHLGHVLQKHRGWRSQEVSRQACNSRAEIKKAVASATAFFRPPRGAVLRPPAFSSTVTGVDSAPPSRRAD